MTKKLHTIPRWKPSQIPFREMRLTLKSVTPFPLERNCIMSHSHLFFAYNTNRWIHIHLNIISWELLCPIFSLNLLVHSDLMLMKPNMMQFGVVLMISSLSKNLTTQATKIIVEFNYLMHIFYLHRPRYRQVRLQTAHPEQYIYVWRFVVFVTIGCCPILNKKNTYDC